MAISDLTIEACSRQLVRLSPMLMRVIRQCVQSADDQLSIPHLRVLQYLSENPGSSLTDLSARLNITNATASSHVEKLVQRQLVKRTDHPSERRRIVLTLTSEGTHSLEQSKAYAIAAFSELLEPLAPAEVRKLIEALTLLEGAVTAPDGTNKGTLLHSSVDAASNGAPLSLPVSVPEVE